MAIEIERKFLVRNDEWRRDAGPGVRFRQGYLAGGGKASVRIRIEGDRANLNIKGATPGVRRAEYEYEIPVADAEEMLSNLCEGGLIEKTRYEVKSGAHLWEIDLFEGANAGLVVAEIELSDEEEPFERPGWVGEEVSEDIRYYNVYLAGHPFSSW